MPKRRDAALGQALALVAQGAKLQANTLRKCLCGHSEWAHSSSNLSCQSYGCECKEYIDLKLATEYDSMPEATCVCGHSEWQHELDAPRLCDDCPKADCQGYLEDKSLSADDLERWLRIRGHGKLLDVSKNETIPLLPATTSDNLIPSEYQCICGHFRSEHKWAGSWELRNECEKCTTCPKFLGKMVSKSTGTTYASCGHWRDAISILGGEILCSGYFDRPKTITDESLMPYPDVGYYLDWQWPKILGNVMSCGMEAFVEPLWPFTYIDWPDRGIISDEYLRTLADAIAIRLKAGQRIEVACMGGHGRTGTVLAAVLVLHGLEYHNLSGPKEAIEWLRKAYCSSIIETDAQVAQIFRLVGAENTTLSPLCVCKHGRRKHRGTRVEKDGKVVKTTFCRRKGCNCWTFRQQKLVVPATGSIHGSTNWSNYYD